MLQMKSGNSRSLSIQLFKKVPLVSNLDFVLAF